MPRRDNNARHNKQRAQQPERHSHRASPSLSPPAQLPTPLPEEQIPHLSQLFLPTTMDYPPVAHPPVAHPQPLGSPGHEALAETSSARLIDLDTPPFQLASLPVEEVSIDDQEEDDGDRAFASTYHSPPFREAPLPNQVGSPPPLPIPLRIPYPQDYFEDVGPNDPVDGGSSGHVRSPTFSRYVLSFTFRFGSGFLFSYMGGLPMAPAAVTRDDPFRKIPSTPLHAWCRPFHLPVSLAAVSKVTSCFAKTERAACSVPNGHTFHLYFPRRGPPFIHLMFVCNFGIRLPTFHSSIFKVSVFFCLLFLLHPTPTIFVIPAFVLYSQN